MDLVAAGIGESWSDSQRVCFSIAPRTYEFAADAVFELPLAVDDQNACAAFGHVFGERSATNAAAGDGQIIGCGHAYFLQTEISVFCLIGGASKAAPFQSPSALTRACVD
jgi:hypothetical protein